MSTDGQLKRMCSAAEEIRLECQRGATAIEYALILMTVALVIMIGIGSFGTAVSNLYNTIVERIFS